MNWHKAQENGISFAYVKSTEGSRWVDPQFLSNAGKLSGNAIIWGPYHFWSANGGVSNQLNHFWGTISPSGYNLPPAIDVEVPPTRISRSRFKSNVYSALIRLKTRMEANGDYRKPLLYTSPGFFNSYLLDSVLVWDDICELWLAHWNVAYPAVPSGFDTYRIHQYSSDGPGQLYGAQSNRIDMNRYNGTTEELLEWGSVQVQPQKLDMGQYFLPVAGDFGPIYILKNNWGGGDERVQLQRDGLFSFVVKNSQWEKRLIGQDYINLVMDTSPGNNEFYTVNGTWLPRKMNVGESFTRTEHVQYFSKGSCTKLRETTWTSQLKFVAHFATFTNADITLSNVVQLAWIRNDVVEEEYWYAAGIGLVKWRSKHGLESGITELIPVGEQENNVREKINCI
jgi:lysozyme